MTGLAKFGGAATALTLLLSLQGDTQVVIPQAQRTNYRAEKAYRIYTIYIGPAPIASLPHAPGESVWKYGITSAGSRRPSSQLRGCELASGQPCTFEWVGSATGYYNARAIEVGLITDYVGVYGHCPPGQFLSCK